MFLYYINRVIGIFFLRLDLEYDNIRFKMRQRAYF